MTNILKNIPENLHVPLRAFITEIKSHLEFFKSIDINSLHADEELELVRKKLEGRFHLIRGASGFFKLDELRLLAKKGEEEFRDAKTDYTKIRNLILSFLQDANKEIDKIYAELTKESGEN